MTNQDKIQATMSKFGAMCDDCLSSAAMVKPRQAVNILCRQLEQQTILTRRKDACPRCRVTKIVNRSTAGAAGIGSNETMQVHSATPTQSGPLFGEGSFSSSVLFEVVRELAEKLAEGETEVYNEFSLQHELGILLRKRLPERLVQFERNVSYFGLKKPDFEKREIDIVVFDRERSLLDAAVELKFPRNGQHPEQMFSFCKDISFLEQLKASGFNRAYFVVFAEDRLFYEGNQTGIYAFFRGGRELSGSISKPTGKRDKSLVIRGSYKLEWHDVYGSTKFAIVEVQ